MKAHVWTMLVAGASILYPNWLTPYYGWFLVVWGLVGAILVLLQPKEPNHDHA